MRGIWLLAALALVLSGCTHAWDADGGAAWNAQQRAQVEAQQNAVIQQQAAQIEANERSYCEKYAGPFGTQPYRDCRWQITEQRMTVMSQSLQAVPQFQPTTITPFSCRPDPFFLGGVNCN